MFITQKNPVKSNLLLKLPSPTHPGFSVRDLLTLMEQTNHHSKLGTYTNFSNVTHFTLKIYLSSTQILCPITFSVQSYFIRNHHKMGAIHTFTLNK